MSYAGYAVKQCFNCGAEDNEPSAKFCGNCGAGWNFSAPAAPMAALQGVITQDNLPVLPPNAVPSFATVNRKGADTKQFYDELGKILILLARERLFLLLHWLLFLSCNIIGCVIAWKCYSEFFGDEMSRIMVACTPFLFINSMALLFIVPIRGTRREIARLKERLSYVKFKIQYGHLI